MRECAICGNPVRYYTTGDYCNDCIYTTLEIAQQDREYWNDKYDEDEVE